MFFSKCQQSLSAHRSHCIFTKKHTFSNNFSSLFWFSDLCLSDESSCAGAKIQLTVLKWFQDARINSVTILRENLSRLKFKRQDTRPCEFSNSEPSTNVFRHVGDSSLMLFTS